MATIRRRRNKIISLKNDSSNWIHESRDVELLATRYYKNLFPVLEILTQLPRIDSFPKLEEVDLRIFSKDISDEEIYSTIKSFGSFKVPSPDGFQAIFFQS